MLPIFCGWFQQKKAELFCSYYKLTGPGLIDSPIACLLPRVYCVYFCVLGFGNGGLSPGNIAEPIISQPASSDDDTESIGYPVQVSSPDLSPQ